MDVDTSKVGLYDFPDEILLPLMIELDDTSLLNMTFVCHRFRAIAKEAFSKKYTDDGAENFFELKLRCNKLIADKVKYRPFFATFGEKLTAIRIVDYSRNADLYHWLIEQIRRFCKTLTRLSICGGKEVNLREFIDCVPSLSHLYLKTVGVSNQSWAESTYPQLVSFQAADMKNVDEDSMLEFINNNRQLEELSLKGSFSEINAYIFFSLDGKLPNLKTLCLDFPVWGYFEYYSSSIELNSLEILEISGNEFFMEILNALTSCQSLKKISLKSNKLWDESVFDALCQFKQLTTLKMTAFDLKPGKLEAIVEQLPNLTELYLLDVCADEDADIYEHLLQILRIGTKLSYLKIYSNDWHPELSYRFIAELGELTKYNALKIALERFNDRVTSHRGEVRSKNLVLYWDGYDTVHSQSTKLLDLNDECLQRIVSFLNINDQYALFYTCQKTRQLIKDTLLENGLRLSKVNVGWPTKTADVEEKVFRSMWPHIRKIQIDRWHGWTSEWHVYEWLRKYCKNLEELCVTNMAHIGRLICNECSPWPKLTKVKILSISDDFAKLCNFNLAKVKHLEIGYIKTEFVSIAHTDYIRNLTVLKFGCFNDSVNTFLKGLKDDICQQLQELMLTNIARGHEGRNEKDASVVQQSSIAELVQLIARFRNLSTLRLLVRGIGKQNMQSLFENCTKLVRLSICYNGNTDMFDWIEARSQQIESIEVVSEIKCNELPHDFMRKVQALLPGGAIEWFFIDGDKIVPFDQTKRVPSSLTFTY